MFKYLYFFLILLISCTLKAQQLAFPEAEGFGRFATGGRGGAVIEVTNLNDKGEGSLRAAIQQSGPRTIVFRVSGTIYLQSQLDINNGDLTIAGQTAPGDGITLANYNFEVKSDNVIIRYIRSRMGDVTLQQDDAFTCRNHKNIIIDHCTFSWGIDEVASIYMNENFTLQWCIISESLYHSIHEKGDHGYGGIWGGSRASFHHNLLAHHSSRNPRFNGARYKTAPWEEIVDFRNNVIYNWGSNSSYGGDPSELDGIKARINMVNNYYKAGPGTRTGQVQYRILEPYDMLSYGFSYFYIDSNYVYGHPEVTEDNWTLGVQNVTTEEKAAMRSDTAFEYQISAFQTAEEAFSAVLAGAGAIFPRRDTIDKRIIHETETGTATYGGAEWGTGTGIIDSQKDVGGWPELFSAPALSDRDHDGMPDNWETSNNLDPDNPDDRNDDMLGEGYTNLEYYLNSINTFPDFLKPPSGITIESGLDVVQLTWINNSDSAEGIFIEKKAGTGEFSILDTLDPAAVSYSDSGLSTSTRYSYRMKSFSATDTSIYSVVVSTTTLSGLSELTVPQVSVYPNPADRIIHISVKGEIIKTVILNDVTGKTVKKQTVSGFHDQIKMDTENLNSGTYFILILTQNSVYTEKLIIRR